MLALTSDENILRIFSTVSPEYQLVTDEQMDGRTSCELRRHVVRTMHARDKNYIIIQSLI